MVLVFIVLGFYIRFEDDRAEAMECEDNFGIRFRLLCHCLNYCQVSKSPELSSELYRHKNTYTYNLYVKKGRERNVILKCKMEEGNTICINRMEEENASTI
jgi:hypothetical protein